MWSMQFSNVIETQDVTKTVSKFDIKPLRCCCCFVFFVFFQLALQRVNPLVCLGEIFFIGIQNLPYFLCFCVFNFYRL